MKAIMSMAHGIREAAAKTWGGKAADYHMGIALEMAWEAHRNVKEKSMSISIEITGEKIGTVKPWVAKITGIDPKWGLKREFIEGITDYSSANSVKSRGVETTWLITEPGIYEYNIPKSWKRTDRGFMKVLENGDWINPTKAEILESLKAA